MRPTTRKVGAALSAAGIAAYTAAVFHQDRENEKNSAKLFSPGSGDEVVKNGLATGDVVLFNRRWYRYHLPEALCIKAYQQLMGTDFDHVGVIVCDKYGTPHVFENSFFGGCTLRPFEQRVLKSKAQQIVVLPLLPRGEKRAEEEEKLAKYVDSCVARRANLYHILFPILGFDVILGTFPTRHIVQDCFRLLGIKAQASNGDRQVTSNQQFLDRKCVLSGTAPSLRLGHVVVVRAAI